MKDLVRLRKQVDQYFLMESQLKSMAMQMGTLQAQSEINFALKAATQTMGKVNESMDVKDIQQIMKQFAKESEKMGVKMELVLISENKENRWKQQQRMYRGMYRKRQMKLISRF